MAAIIMADLVPLVERGFFQALLVLTWAFAAAIGPVIVSTVVPVIFINTTELVLSLRVAHLPRKSLGDGSSVSVELIFILDALLRVDMETSISRSRELLLRSWPSFFVFERLLAYSRTSSLASISCKVRLRGVLIQTHREITGET